MVTRKKGLGEFTDSPINRRGEVLFQKLMAGDLLSNSVRELRAKYGIDPKNYMEFVRRSNTFKIPNGIYFRTPFVRDIRCHLGLNSLPENQWWVERLMIRVITDDKVDLFTVDGIGGHTPYMAPFIESFFTHTKRTAKVGTVDIKLFSGVSQRDLNAYMAQHWDYLRPYYAPGTKKNFRKETLTKRRDLVIKAYSLSKDKLGYLPTQPATKPEMVSTYMQQRYGMKVSAENVQKIVRRTKNLKR